MLLAATLLGACTRSAPPAPHAVHYVVAWARDGVVPAGDGWEVTTDLGYRVRVTRGYLTSYSMELVECPKAAWSVLSPPPAWAGHSAGTPNPAAIRPMQVESLLATTDREIGAVTLAPQTYCQLHYLIARAGREAQGLPSDLDMVDASLHVDGTYRAPAADAPTPFAIHTAIANGGLFDHTGAAAPIRVDMGQGATRVTVRRHLGSLFDGVDFATTSDSVRASRILASVVEHVEVELASVE